MAYLVCILSLIGRSSWFTLAGSRYSRVEHPTSCNLCVCHYHVPTIADQYRYVVLGVSGGDIFADPHRRFVLRLQRFQFSGNSIALVFVHYHDRLSDLASTRW